MKRDSEYLIDPVKRAHAQAAAEQLADKLRAERHEVTIMVTMKKAGGR